MKLYTTIDAILLYCKITTNLLFRGRYEESYGFRPIGYMKKSRFYNNNITLCGLQTCKRCGMKIELGK